MNNSEKQWQTIYKIGAVTTIIVLCGIILDIVAGSITGGDMTALPQTSIDRCNQFKGNRLLGLYNLDLLNIINQIILIPSIFALFYGIFGVMKLAVYLDILLVFGAVSFLVKYILSFKF